MPGESTRTVRGEHFPPLEGRGHPHGEHWVTPASIAKSLSPQQVLLATEDGERMVIGLLDAQPPNPASGGGWDAVARPKRRPLTVWRGYGDAPRLPLAIIFDGHATNRSVERECNSIDFMAGGFRSDDPEPPQLLVFGKAIPQDNGKEPQHRWVIAEAPEWVEDDQIRRADGRRTRQHVNLTLWLVAQAHNLRRVHPRKHAPKHKLYTVHKGDTYEKIAAHRLGNRRLGRRLAKLNGDRDPTKKLKAGHRIKLPSAKTLAEWRRELHR